MQPMWCYAGNPVDLDDTDWRITPVDTNAKDSLNPEAFHLAQALVPCCADLGRRKWNPRESSKHTRTHDGAVSSQGESCLLISLFGPLGPSPSSRLTAFRNSMQLTTCSQLPAWKFASRESKTSSILAYMCGYPNLPRADLVDWSMAYMPLQKDNRCSKQGRTPRPYAAVWVLLTAAASKEAKDVHE